MATQPAFDRGNDPCLQIQVDLSAMLDGELDPASVRRVMVHSDVCASCKAFLRGIRDQVRFHRELAGIGELEGADEVVAAGVAPELAQRAEQLRRKLTENRRKLSRILYELGRGFVLMGLSPDFSREVSKEPVPVPDMAQRGRNLLDEVSRSPEGVEHDWVLAKELLDGQLRTPDENLAKGQRLLSECLALDSRKHEARIYLGLAHYVRGQRSLARKQFTLVLAATEDRLARAYALLNLGNIHLDEGDNDGAVELLLQLVESGVVEEQPRLSMSYFNLGLAYGMQGRFSDCLHWFRRLHDEMPHKRAAVSRELERRRQFVHLVRNHPEARIVAEAFPGWFAAVDC